MAFEYIEPLPATEASEAIEALPKALAETDAEAVADVTIASSLLTDCNSSSFSFNRLLSSLSCLWWIKVASILPSTGVTGIVVKVEPEVEVE
jgi:hypothetical protein